MYNSSYSQAKFGLEAKTKIHKPRGKSCGYYMRIVFFFSSLIQSLIIVGLVLFLVYGKSQDSAAEMRIQDLEQSFNRLSMDNVALKQKASNLTRLLNVTLTENQRNKRDLLKMRHLSNISATTIRTLNTKLGQYEMEKRILQTSRSGCPVTPCGDNNQVLYLQDILKIVETNFTQTVQLMRMEMENTIKERNNHNLENIGLRRDKASLKNQLEAYGRKCKEDFVQSLGGISNVTKAFLEKIDSLFPLIFPFQLTCEKQHDHLEQIRNNCTSLSREVENKFQRYLNEVSNDVSKIQGRSSHLQVENSRLDEDYKWCSKNRSAMAWEHSQMQQRTKEKHDKEIEKLLMEQKRLHGDKELQGSVLKVKEGEINILNFKIKSLNASLANCVPRPAAPKPGQFPGASITFPKITNTRGIGSTGPSSTGVGGLRIGKKPGSTMMGFDNTWSGTGVGSTGGLGSPGMGNTGFGNTGIGSTGSSSAAMGGAGSSLSSSAGGRMNGPGMGGTNNYILNPIEQHLRDLARYSNPSGSDDNPSG